MMTSWKTTAAGVAAILGAVGDVLHQFATGQFDQTHLMLDWTTVTTGIGLIMAKDHNK